MKIYDLGIYVGLLVISFLLGYCYLAVTLSQLDETYSVIAPSAEAIEIIQAVVPSYDPFAHIPTWEQYEAIINSSLDDVTEWFNSKYGELLKPILSYDAPDYDETKCYYSLEGTIHIAKSTIWRRTINKHNQSEWFYVSNNTVESTVWHEFCHYAMDKYCHTDYIREKQESFCDVFANISHKDSCTSEYCQPYKVKEVDRENFLDCVFANGCGNAGFKYTHIESCYEKWKL